MLTSSVRVVDVQHTLCVKRGVEDAPSYVRDCVPRHAVAASLQCYSRLLTSPLSVNGQGWFVGGLVEVATLLRLTGLKGLDTVLTFVCEHYPDFLLAESTDVVTIVRQTFALYTTSGGAMSFGKDVGTCVSQMITQALAPETGNTSGSAHSVRVSSATCSASSGSESGSCRPTRGSSLPRVTVASINIEGYSSLLDLLTREAVACLTRMSTQNAVRAAFEQVVLLHPSFGVTTKAQLRGICRAGSKQRLRYVRDLGHTVQGAKLLALVDLFTQLPKEQSGDGDDPSSTKHGGGGSSASGSADDDGGDFSLRSAAGTAIKVATFFRHQLNSLFLAKPGASSPGRRCALAPSGRVRAYPVVLYKSLRERLFLRWREDMAAKLLPAAFRVIQLGPTRTLAADSDVDLGGELEVLRRGESEPAVLTQLVQLVCEPASAATASATTGTSGALDRLDRAVLSVQRGAEDCELLVRIQQQVTAQLASQPAVLVGPEDAEATRSEREAALWAEVRSHGAWKWPSMGGPEQAAAAVRIRHEKLTWASRFEALEAGVAVVQMLQQRLRPASESPLDSDSHSPERPSPQAPTTQAAGDGSTQLLSALEDARRLLTMARHDPDFVQARCIRGTDIPQELEAAVYCPLDMSSPRSRIRLIMDDFARKRRGAATRSTSSTKPRGGTGAAGATKSSSALAAAAAAQQSGESPSPPLPVPPVQVGNPVLDSVRTDGVSLWILVTTQELMRFLSRVQVPSTPGPGPPLVAGGSSSSSGSSSSGTAASDAPTGSASASASADSVPPLPPPSPDPPDPAAGSVHAGTTTTSTPSPAAALPPHLRFQFQRDPRAVTRLHGNLASLPVSFSVADFIARVPGVYSLAVLRALRELPPGMQLLCLDPGVCRPVAAASGRGLSPRPAATSTVSSRVWKRPWPAKFKAVGTAQDTRQAAQSGSQAGSGDVAAVGPTPSGSPSPSHGAGASGAAPAPASTTQAVTVNGGAASAGSEARTGVRKSRNRLTRWGYVHPDTARLEAALSSCTPAGPLTHHALTALSGYCGIVAEYLRQRTSKEIRNARFHAHCKKRSYYDSVATQLGVDKNVIVGIGHGFLGRRKGSSSAVLVRCDPTNTSCQCEHEHALEVTGTPS